MSNFESKVWRGLNLISLENETPLDFSESIEIRGNGETGAERLVWQRDMMGALFNDPSSDQSSWLTESTHFFRKVVTGFV